MATRKQLQFFPHLKENDVAYLGQRNGEHKAGARIDSLRVEKA